MEGVPDKRTQKEGITSLTPLYAGLAAAAKGKRPVISRHPTGEHGDVP